MEIHIKLVNAFVQSFWNTYLVGRDGEATAGFFVPEPTIVGSGEHWITSELQELISSPHPRLVGRSGSTLSDMTLNVESSEGGAYIVTGSIALHTVTLKWEDRLEPLVFTLLLRQTTDGLKIYHFHLSALSPAYSSTEITTDNFRNFQDNFLLEQSRFNIISQLNDSVTFEYLPDSDELRCYDSRRDIPGCNRCYPGFTKMSFETLRLHPEDLHHHRLLRTYLLTGQDDFWIELRHRLLTPGYTWYRITGKTVRDNEGNVLRVIGQFTDVSQRKREMAVLRARVNLDQFTELYNKSAGQQLIESILENRRGQCHAMMILDLDNFKTINDTYGHIIGDQVLSDVSVALRGIFRTSDILVRYGGDEFLIFMRSIAHQSVAVKKADEIYVAFASLPVSRQYGFKLTGSIGLSLCPEHGDSYADLCKCADAALYSAKAMGKNRYFIFGTEAEPEAEAIAAIPQILSVAATPKICEHSPLHGVQFSTPELFTQYTLDKYWASNDITATTLELFSEIGMVRGLSRIFILELSEDSTRLYPMIEWRAEGVSSISDFVSFFSYGAWEPQLDYSIGPDGIIQIPDCRLQSENHNQSIAKKLNTGAKLECPIIISGITVGTLGFDVCGEPRAWTGQDVDVITALARVVSVCLMRQQGRRSDRLLMSLAASDNTPIRLYLLEPDSYNIIYANNALIHDAPATCRGATCHLALGNRQQPCDPCPLNCKNTGSVEIYSSNRGTWVSASAKDVTLANGDSAVLVTNIDITDFKKQSSSNDYLTGLLTSSQFEKLATERINAPDAKRCALVYCDFEKFKYINDLYGYQTGNTILVSFAAFLTSFIITGELACRYSSDMFLALLECSSEQELIERIKTLDQQYSLWSSRYFGEVNIALTSGIYIVKPGDKDLSLLIDRANIARKSIKGSHVSSSAVYDEKLHAQITKEKQIVSRMHHALENGEFVIYLQPKIDLATDTIVGAEALVRWRQSDGSIIMPNDFIDLFERNGFIRQLDAYVHRAVFKMIRTSIDYGQPPIPVSVNVSRITAKSPDFVSSIRNLVDVYAIPPSMLEFELTENLFLEELEPIVKKISELKELGFQFSIDDFGSGYSSLNLLRQLPIDILKLDKDFFRHVDISSRDRTLLSSIIRMTRDLGMRSLAEGVETREQASFLKSVGCNYAQGFLYGKPMPQKQFRELLTGRVERRAELQ